MPNLMSKWKNLAILRLVGTFQMQEILAQINIHCKNFIGLGILGAYIEQGQASTIVTLLPNIKQLILRHASHEKENLVMILQGCKELKYFDVRDCIGFDEGDDEILKLASHIQTFKPEGSMLYDYYYDYSPILINEYQVKGKFSFTAIVKTLVKHSVTTAVYVSLPDSGFCDEEVLFYIADQ
ncbi:hypothetical protein HYC85_026833 [Camellia sinensis]|uniref:FBD domain-containing protein n=1 Tax=Camellia sinensis TaxID=4442 RepID=A0A7J7G8N2_CAMSI|nr:hypothetical protein HYC85_026833 [Camellia sinensis]